jgi:hypothetical protein
MLPLPLPWKPFLATLFCKSSPILRRFATGTVLRSCTLLMRSIMELMPFGVELRGVVVPSGVKDGREGWEWKFSVASGVEN